MTSPGRRFSFKTVLVIAGIVLALLLILNLVLPGVRCFFTGLLVAMMPSQLSPELFGAIVGGLIGIAGSLGAL
jgi:hypothetical protein